MFFEMVSFVLSQVGATEAYWKRLFAAAGQLFITFEEFIRQRRSIFFLQIYFLGCYFFNNFFNRGLLGEGVIDFHGAIWPAL